MNLIVSMVNVIFDTIKHVSTFVVKIYLDEVKVYFKKDTSNVISNTQLGKFG